MTKIGLISLFTLKKAFARIVPKVAIRGTCGTWHTMCFTENNNGRSKWEYTVTGIPHLRLTFLFVRISIYISTIACGYQTCQDGDLQWGPPTHEHTWPFDHEIFWDQHFISTSQVPITTKLVIDRSLLPI